eukprot:760331-Amphidinium_carterae.1
MANFKNISPTLCRVSLTHISLDGLSRTHTWMLREDIACANPPIGDHPHKTSRGPFLCLQQDGPPYKASLSTNRQERQN